MKEGSHVDLGVVRQLEWNDDVNLQRSEKIAIEADQEKLVRYYQTIRDKLGQKVQLTQKGIKITLEDDLMFPAASAGLTPAGRKMLDRICTMLKQTNLYVRIEGHTDNSPIATRKFPSNWELSTARAVNVVKYLIKKGIEPRRLSAAGYGAVKPVAPNFSASGRARNRRVEIVLSPTL